jgi:hypothetical protein
MSDDLVAKWNISLPDGKYKIEFEHGTTSGRRVITVNDKVCIYNFLGGRVLSKWTLNFVYIDILKDIKK